MSWESSSRIRYFERDLIVSAASTLIVDDLQGRAMVRFWPICPWPEPGAPLAFRPQHLGDKFSSRPANACPARDGA
jgi:hypothetical protein